MKKLFLAVVLVGVLVSHSAYCDEAARKEAETFLDIMGMENILQQSMEQMLNLQLQQNPSMIVYKKVFMSFFEKYMSYESLKPELIDLYAEAFTAKELKEINDFYGTPTGKKTIQLMPELMGKGAQIGAARVQEHIGELQKMIQQEAERLQALQQETE